MSIRKVTTNEIQAIGSILNDKDAIELLKKINDNIVTEEDTKGKRKQNDIFAFVGFAHQDDVLGEDPESQDYKNKAGSLQKLVDTGLILEGAHIPLARKNEDKYGDVRISSQERIGKYKLTEEGLAVLGIVGAAESTKQEQPKPKQTAAPTVVKKNGSSNSKEQQIAAFKEQVKKENKR